MINTAGLQSKAISNAIMEQLFEANKSKNELQLSSRVFKSL
jgi:hypothetical protein